MGSNPTSSATSVPERALRLRHFFGERLEQPGLRSHDPDVSLGDLDTLGERAQMVAAIAAAFETDALAGGRSELAL